MEFCLEAKGILRISKVTFKNFHRKGSFWDGKKSSVLGYQSNELLK